MPTNPDCISPNQDFQEAIKEDVQLRSFSIVDGLVEAAMQGDAKAFAKLREMAFGNPKAIAEIPLENSLSAAKGGSQEPGPDGVLALGKRERNHPLFHRIQWAVLCGSRPNLGFLPCTKPSHGLRPCETPYKLLSEIASAISKFVKLRIGQVGIVAAFIFASWFAD